MSRTFAALALWCSLPAVVGGAQAAKIDTQAITVSGISAGAAMAQQLHIAYPELFSGVGLIAGVPWGCAEGSVMTALGRCTKTADTLPATETFIAQLRAAAEAGRVGDLGLLADDRAWLFHGTLDTAVAEPVSLAAKAVYEAFIDAGQIHWEGGIPAGHTFPTLDQGNACDALAPPFVGACNFDAAGALLAYLYPGPEQPDPETVAELTAVEIPGAANAGLAATAWLYRPASCPAQGCGLHLVLHGCGQSETQVGKQFMELSGYLPWAAAKQVILAFPQVAASPVNPLACWDWWGYTGANYLDRDGAQLKLLAEWIASLGE